MKELLYGRNPIYECLRAARRDVSQLSIATGVQEKGILSATLRLAQQRRIPIQRLDRHQLDKAVKNANHQGIVAEVSDYPYAGLEAIFRLAQERHEPPWLLLLDCLQDPQNLGTLLRTAEIIGVHGVVIPDRRAAAVTPAVASASSGASEHLLVAQVTNLVQTMKALKAQDVWIAGLEDEPDAELLWQASLGGPLALVVGSEGSGMRRLVKDTCDLKIRLPMVGQINSLNAAVAGSIALYEVAHQRKRAVEPDQTRSPDDQ
ncbi:MAG: 23S rRNA (guanosine(2251)-2'-O)-methyltransferase RlmB [Anaerolineae bacterium]|nr:23S rRNA (guanosine(2251)-2'-O)-methyltransferase RlmB [Anaerolineae bacterium]